MIDSQSTVMFLNTRSSECQTTTFDSLFRQFGNSINYEYPGISKLVFDPEDPYWVRDLDGWTKLIGIYRLEDQIDQWFQLITNHGNQLAVSNTERILVYDPLSKFIGFHGEVKYQFAITNANEIPDPFYMREIVHDTTQAEPVLFGRVQPKIIFKPSRGLIALTKSGHITVNNLDVGAFVEEPPLEKRFK